MKSYILNSLGHFAIVLLCMYGFTTYFNIWAEPDRASISAAFAFGASLTHILIAAFRKKA